MSEAETKEPDFGKGMQEIIDIQKSNTNKLIKRSIEIATDDHGRVNGAELIRLLQIVME